MVPGKRNLEMERSNLRGEPTLTFQQIDGEKKVPGETNQDHGNQGKWRRKSAEPLDGN